MTWPGTLEGFPFRGDTIPDLKQHEMEDQVQHVLDYKCKMFQLWKDEDLEEYRLINDRIANGWYQERRRREEWDEAERHLMIWLEWVQIYGESVRRKHPGLERPNGRSIDG